jgi:hypothetical protein
MACGEHTSDQRDRIRSPASCVIQPAATFVNFIQGTKTLHNDLGILLTAIFVSAAPDPAHNNGCGPLSPLPQKLDTSPVDRSDFIRIHMT